MFSSTSEACSNLRSSEHHRRFVHFTDASSACFTVAYRLEASALLHFHKMLIQQEYHLLFSPKRVRRPGPKGPAKELIDAVVEMKRRNRT